MWSDEDLAHDLSDSDSEPEDNIDLQTADRKSTMLLNWTLLFLVYLQAVFRLSDGVLGHLIKFLKVLFTVLGQFCTICAQIALAFPASLYRARNTNFLRTHAEDHKFKRYVVCRKCHKLYYLQDCVDGTGPRERSKVCVFQQFPNHPHHRMREPCGTLLLRTVELTTGRKVLYPFMTYCYLGLEVSMQTFLNRNGFLDCCEEWRNRAVTPGVLADVYDGQLWKDFQIYNGQPFLSQPFNFALMMNVDFFQPYKHVPYSVGAIYCVVMNLPRNIRYKEENAILVGLIPGPHEPQRDMNTYLEPLVLELLQFWDGIEMTISSSSKRVVRCALLCVACDLPAGRKVCGFLGHSAHLGCSRCFKKFPGVVGALDYSGFDRENWTLRSGSVHRDTALMLRNKTTRTDRDKAESESGCRYSVLLKLPYFDAPRMLPIDPMHNLFLGSSKHFLKAIWIQRNIITSHQFSTIQGRIDSATVPPDIGRIPHKIQCGFASFTADQWKNWVVYFSPIALRNIVSGNNLMCWRYFILACRLLCSKQITTEQVCLSDALLMRFCKMTQDLYGCGVITPNMHMHCHLRACIDDYGPLHSFWLYAFERYNGILGQMPNNNRSIEIQLMKRFLQTKSMFSLIQDLPPEFKEDFLPLFRHPQEVGSLADTLSLPLQKSTPEELMITKWAFESSDLQLHVPSHFSRQSFSTSDVDTLKELYSKLYPNSAISNVSTLFFRYSSIKVRGKLLGCHESRSASSSIVIVSWDCKLFGAPVAEASTLSEFELAQDNLERPARINFFAKHSITVCGRTLTHMLVSLSWFKYHPQKNSCGKPASLWCCDIFEPAGLHSYIPVQFVRSRTISLVENIREGLESVLIVCPCIDF